MEFIRVILIIILVLLTCYGLSNNGFLTLAALGGIIFLSYDLNPFKKILPISESSSGSGSSSGSLSGSLSGSSSSTSKTEKMTSNCMLKSGNKSNNKSGNKYGSDSDSDSDSESNSDSDSDLGSDSEVIGEDFNLPGFGPGSDTKVMPEYPDTDFRKATYNVKGWEWELLNNRRNSGNQPANRIGQFTNFGGKSPYYIPTEPGQESQHVNGNGNGHRIQSYNQHGGGEYDGEKGDMQEGQDLITDAINSMHGIYDGDQANYQYNLESHMDQIAGLPVKNAPYNGNVSSFMPGDVSPNGRDPLIYQLSIPSFMEKFPKQLDKTRLTRDDYLENRAHNNYHFVSADDRLAARGIANDKSRDSINYRVWGTKDTFKEAFEQELHDAYDEEWWKADRYDHAIYDDSQFKYIV